MPGRDVGRMAANYDFRRVRAIFDGDGSEIREQFIFSGLLLAIFERFKEYVVKQVDDFFANRWELRDGDLKCIRGEEFKKLIKEKGVGAKGQHTNKEFRAALHWFYGLGAITQDELNGIERLYELRKRLPTE